MNFNELTGRENKDLVSIHENEIDFKLTKKTKEAFLDLKSDLKDKSIKLSLVSAYRSYEHQLKIWNLKATGHRKLLDSNGKELDFNKLSKPQILQAILRWSALPGASRHHWGTEIDIFDLNCKDKSQVQLTLNECTQDFHNLYNYLPNILEDYGFYRPYQEDLGGVSPEPWHLSFKGESIQAYNDYTLETLENSLRKSTDLQMKDLILSKKEEIFNKYIMNISQ